MNSQRPIWQLAGRAAGRSFVDVLIKHGEALLGPGDAGPWSPDRDDNEFEGGFVRRFATEVRVGDPIVLRSGGSRIMAVGLVASEYCYLEAFDDVVGLDLQHARRVRWTELPEEYAFGEAVFGPMPATFGAVQSPPVQDYVRRFLNSPPEYWQEARLPQLPEEEPRLETVPEWLQESFATASDLRPLFLDQARFGSPPTEDEIVAHLVVPFLRALGWPPERMAIKWRNIDVSLHDALPRTNDSCRVVLEAKRLGAGVESALEQAQRYVITLGSPRDIVVTDGIRYRMYDGANNHAPVAYANLARLKSSAIELFDRLSHP